MNRIDTLATGGVGVTAIEVINNTAGLEASQGGISAVIQIIIGIITIFKLIKKKKENVETK